MTSMAQDALAAYVGNRLVYIGESEGGCCALDEFYAALAAGWTETACIEIPQRWGVHDYVRLFRLQPDSFQLSALDNG